MTCFRRGAAAFAAALFVSSSAVAATEAHETAREVRISIASDGSAHIDETLHFRLLYSGWKGVDVPGLESDAQPDGQATFTSIEGGTLQGNLTVAAPGVLRLDSLEPKGLKKGDWAAHFSYRTSLVAAHEIARDGALWRVTWTSNAPSEGVDSMRVVFDFPAAPTEPAAANDDTDGILATLRRSGDRDEIDLVRPHVARGEAVAWSVRFDPKALGAVRDPSLRPPPPARPKEIVDPFARFGAPWRAFGAALLGIAFAITAFARSRDASSSSVLRSLVGLTPAPAAFLGGIGYGAGTWLELTGSPRSAALVFALTILATAMRARLKKPAPRGPGAWKTIAEPRAFRVRASAFDLRSLRGLAFLGSLSLVAVVAIVALRSSDVAAWSSVLPAVAPWLVFWVATPRRSLGDVTAAAIALRPIFKAIRATGARVAAWGRLPVGRREIDDLRLLVVPDAALPGLVGIEVAVGWLGLAGGATPRFEVHVRARDATAAAAKLGSLAKAARALTGRRPEERVYVLEPRDGSPKSVVDLVMASAEWLVDRRLVPSADEPAPWKGAERRKPILAPALSAHA